MATNELIIEKLKEIIVHVGLAGEYAPGYDVVKNLRKTKCKECIRLADELQVLESQAKEPSDEIKYRGTPGKFSMYHVPDQGYDPETDLDSHGHPYH